MEQAFGQMKNKVRMLGCLFNYRRISRLIFAVIEIPFFDQWLFEVLKMGDKFQILGEVGYDVGIAL